MYRITSRARSLIALAVGTLVMGVLFAPGQGRALEKQDLQKALLSTVKILVLDPDLEVLGTCSGTHLGDGVILTNWHCVGHTDLYGEDDTGLGLSHGDTYHPDGIVGIAPQKDPRQIPKPTYFAQVASGEADLDVAVVKIVSMIDPKADLPDAIPIPAMTITDSSKVEIGDPVYVFGYPGVGGQRITYTKGEISGYEDQTGDGEPDSFKTDASVNPGNSGGLATNDEGDQIGIPTFNSLSPSGGAGLSGLREVNLAVPYVNQALQLGNATPAPLPTGTVRPSTPGPTPGAGSNFGSIRFGTDFVDGELVDEGTEFESGTSQILGLFTFQNMRDGTKWGAVWYYDGQAVIDQRNAGVWRAGARGTNGVSLANEDGLPDGEYELELYISNKAVQRAGFTIGDGSPNPTPQPPDPVDTGVTLKGQIVDVDTERGIENAVILILKPGVTVEDLTEDNLEENTAAFGITDSEGFYITAPPLERDQTYTVVVVADGYEARVFEDALTISEDDPELLEIEPIPMAQE
ncbi:MAG TPA: trypsin-like peptidase domain-containing protein [Chloroflexia bacterium]|nr:trypsin-like peptidase domain-containing protein [Chloroflexia bacterium]